MARLVRLSADRPPPASIAVAIIQDEDAIVPSGSTLLRHGDHILLAVQPQEQAANLAVAWVGGRLPTRIADATDEQPAPSRDETEADPASTP